MNAVVKASEVKVGQTVNVPNVGYRIITDARKSRRYKGFMQLQWSPVDGDYAGQAEVKLSDILQLKG
jgi:hypothetical protein